jgi:NAD(P)H-quinone oxidoreductase subunit 6
VYVGGTSTLFFLSAVLLPHVSAAASNAPRARRGAAFTTMILGVALAVVAAGTIWPVDAELVQVSATAKIGHALLGAYLLPFELASVVLTTALVGALVIARRDAKSGAT